MALHQTKTTLYQERQAEKVGRNSSISPHQESYLLAIYKI